MIATLLLLAAAAAPMPDEQPVMKTVDAMRRLLDP